MITTETAAGYDDAKLADMLSNFCSAIVDGKGVVERCEKDLVERKRGLASDEANYRVLLTEFERRQGPWRDEALPENKDICDAHPTRTGRHDLYAEAMRLVGVTRSKGDLVALVNWLLHRAEKKP